MLLPIKAICNPRKQRKDGTCVIFIQYCYTSQSRTLLDTGVVIPPGFWNNKKGCITDRLPSTLGNAEALNQKILKSMRIVEDIISYALRKADIDTVKFVKKHFSPEFNIDVFLKNEKTKNLNKENPPPNLNLYYQIEDYIESTQKQKKHAKTCLGYIEI